MQQNPNGRWRWIGAAAMAWAGWQLLRATRERELTGDVVLITGGSRGLGLLLAREYARHGWPVNALFRGDRLGAVNRLLPDAHPGETGESRGRKLAATAPGRPLTGMLYRAARATHQYASQLR